MDAVKRKVLSFNIFQILFQVDTVDIKRLETVNTWIIKRNPLLAVTFAGDYGKTRDRPATYKYPEYVFMMNFFFFNFVFSFLILVFNCFMVKSPSIGIMSSKKIGHLFSTTPSLNLHLLCCTRLKY